MTGPIASPAAPNTAQSPIAPARSSGGYSPAMIASAGATTPAAPTPMSARAAMSVSVVVLSAASRQADPKSAYPARNTRRRP